MANNPQFKVSQLAKDLNIKNKDILDVLSGAGITVKSAQTALDPAHFDILFETLTRNNQIDSIDKYMSGETYIPSKKPKEEKKVEAPKAETPKAEAPKAEAPKAEPVKAAAPKAEAPKSAAPQKKEAPAAPAREAAKPAQDAKQARPTPAQDRKPEGAKRP